MKRSVVAALGAAVIATFVASSAAQAAFIDFFFSARDGSITHDGARLDMSSQLDFDGAIMLVMDVAPGDASGLMVGDVISLTADTPWRAPTLFTGLGTSRLTFRRR